MQEVGDFGGGSGPGQVSCAGCRSDCAAGSGRSALRSHSMPLADDRGPRAVSTMLQWAMCSAEHGGTCSGVGEMPVSRPRRGHGM